LVPFDRVDQPGLDAVPAHPTARQIALEMLRHRAHRCLPRCVLLLGFTRILWSAAARTSHGRAVGTFVRNGSSRWPLDTGEAILRSRRWSAGHECPFDQEHFTALAGLLRRDRERTERELRRAHQYRRGVAVLRRRRALRPAGQARA